MQMVAGKSQNRPRFPFDMQMSHQASPPSFFSIKLFQSARHEKQSVITGNVKYLSQKSSGQNLISRLHELHRGFRGV